MYIFFVSSKRNVWLRSICELKAYSQLILRLFIGKEHGNLNIFLYL